MKLLGCLTTVLMLLSSNVAVDVERTVKQVQNILQANIDLPRLSRDEIIQLLNDIRAEDAKSKSSSEYSREDFRTTTPYSSISNEVNGELDIQDNLVPEENSNTEVVTVPTFIRTTAKLRTTTKPEPSVMVVLPYTPRDGASLQELYTRPPRTEVVPESKVTPKPLAEKANDKLRDTLKSNAQLANKKKVDFPEELQTFLDSHGLKGKPGQDHFLLPLDGFKPLPPAKVVDGSVQLPENILLSYDLITPEVVSKQKPDKPASSQNNYMYEPLRPEFPFELETSSSEKQKTILPLDMPKRRETKSATPAPNYEPIDYDSVKVIPLNKGPNPVEDERIVLENDQDKRQANISSESQTVSVVEESTTTPESDVQDKVADVPSDTGASIADLEESFGGAVPEQPGDSQLPPPRKNGFYWMVDWNSFLEVGDGDTKVNIRFEPKLGDPQMFLPVSVP